MFLVFLDKRTHKKWSYVKQRVFLKNIFGVVFFKRDYIHRNTNEITFYVTTAWIFTSI